MGTAVLVVPPVVKKLAELYRQSKRDETTQVESPESIESIYRLLADSQNDTADQRLCDAIAALLEISDFEEVRNRLEGEVRDWCLARPEGAGNPLDHTELARALWFIVRNAHEAAYLLRFAERFSKVESVDSKAPEWIEEVFVVLESYSDAREGDHGEQHLEDPKYLDFRGKSPTEMETMLRNSGNIAILGDPGAGKSTLLRYLAAVCADSDSSRHFLPFFLPLREYADDPDKLISAKASRYVQDALQVTMPENFFDDALKQGRCLVCLDALDEVPPEKRLRVIRNIKTLADKYPGNRFIVTSRTAGYDHRPLDKELFRKYLVQPMNRDDIAAFVRKRFPGNPDQANDVLGLLENHPELYAIAGNSLHLTLLSMASRYQSTAGLVFNRTAFYRETVAHLVRDQDDAGRSVDAQMPKLAESLADPVRRTELLVRAAYIFRGNSSTVIDKGDLTEDLVALISDQETGLRLSGSEARSIANSFVDLAQQRIGLLAESPPGSGKLGFVHSTFVEYLMAEYIRLVHPDRYWEEIRDHLSDPQWREVILFLLGGLPPGRCSALTERILEAGRSTPTSSPSRDLEYHLNLAADALAQQAPMSVDLQQQIVSTLAEHRYNASTRDVLAGLSKIKHIPNLTLPVVADIANNPLSSEQDRIHAAEILRTFGQEKEAVEVLIGIANDPSVEDYFVVDVALALERLGERNLAIGYLTAVIDRNIYSTPFGANWRNRIKAAEALASVGKREIATSVLISSFIYPCDGLDCLTAAGILSELGEIEISSYALSMVSNDDRFSHRNRISAVNILLNIGELGAAEKALKSTLKNQRELSSGDLSVIVKLLVKSGARSTAIELLTKISSMSDDLSVNVGVAKALALLGERELAIKILSDSIGENIRRGNSADPGSRSRLFRMYNFDQSISKVETLSEMVKSESPIDRLKHILISSHSLFETTVIRMLIDALAKSGEIGFAVQILSEVANDGTRSLNDRREFAEYLNDLGDQETSVRVLREIASRSTGTDSERIDAAEALGRIQDKESASNILRIIAHSGTSSRESRIDAVRGLANMGELAGPLDIELMKTNLVSDAISKPDTGSSLDWHAVILDRMGDRESAVALLTTGLERTTTRSHQRVYYAEHLAKLGQLDAAHRGWNSIAEDGYAHAVDRMHAAKWTGRTGNREAAIRYLKVIAEENKTPALIDASVELWWQGAKEEATSYLTDLVRNPNVLTSIRLYAEYLLYRLGEIYEGMEARVVQIVEDELAKIEVRQGALNLALLLKNHKDAAAWLVGMSKEEGTDPELRLVAAWELGNMRENDVNDIAVAALVTLAKNPDLDRLVRMRANLALLFLKRPEVLLVKP